MSIDYDELRYLFRNLIVGYGKFTNAKMPSFPKIEIKLQEYIKHSGLGPINS